CREDLLASHALVAHFNALPRLVTKDFTEITDFYFYPSVGCHESIIYKIVKGCDRMKISRSASQISRYDSRVRFGCELLPEPFLDAIFIVSQPLFSVFVGVAARLFVE